MNERTSRYRGNRHRQESASRDFIFQKTVFTRRVNKTVKGGRNISFYAMSVVGNQDGSVGLGVGKTRSMATAIDKSYESAKKNLISVKKIFCINYKYCSTTLIIRKRSRDILCTNYYIGEIMNAAGIKNISCKIIGSKNTINVISTLFRAFRHMNYISELMIKREKVYNEDYQNK